MRCPKCGKISFDYLENCSNCGQDLRKISAGLGGFAKPDSGLIWFSMDPRADSAETETEAPLVEQIDSGDLETVADNEVFQQALDQVLKDK